MESKELGKELLLRLGDRFYSPLIIASIHLLKTNLIYRIKNLI
jgi:hypothetical protein